MMAANAKMFNRPDSDIVRAALIVVAALTHFVEGWYKRREILMSLLVENACVV